jgi:hypothetical protein
MAKLDEGQHGVELCLLVVGGASDVFQQALPLTDGVLKLREVASWRPSLRVHCFGRDPFSDAEEATRLNALFAEADALVLTDAPEKGRHYASSAIEQVERAIHLGKPGIPTAVFGGQALADEWVTLSSNKPLFVGEPNPENAMQIIKALLRVTLRTTTRPPPRA